MVGSIEEGNQVLPEALSMPGVDYVIWNKRTWKPDGSSSPYTGGNPHTDHLHIHVEPGAGSGGSGGASFIRGNAPQSPVRGAMPQSPSPSGGFKGATGAVAMSSKQDIANYIRNSAIEAGYTPEEADAFVIQAFGESGLDPGSYGAGTGDASGGASGVFQFTPDTWSDFGQGDPMDPRANIDAYMRLAAERDPRTGSIKDRLAAISGGGPAHPNNVGHWDRAVSGAQPYLAGDGSTAMLGATGPMPGQSYSDWYDEETKRMREQLQLDDARDRITDLQEQVAEEEQAVQDAQAELDEYLAHPELKQDPEDIEKLREALEERKKRLADTRKNLERAKTDLTLTERDMNAPSAGEDWWGSDNPYFKILEGLSELMPDFTEMGNIASGGLQESLLPEGFSNPFEWGMVKSASGLMQWLGGLRKMGSNEPLLGGASHALAIGGAALGGSGGGIVDAVKGMIPEPLGTLPIGDPTTEGPPSGRPDISGLLGMANNMPLQIPGGAPHGSGGSPGPGNAAAVVNNDNRIQIGEGGNVGTVHEAQTTGARWNAARGRQALNLQKVNRI